MDKNYFTDEQVKEIYYSAADVLVEALKYQRTRCEDIIDIRLIDEAIATYDKLSEVSDDL